MAQPKMIRRFLDGRLVYFSQTADESYWHERWQDRLTRDNYAAALEGGLEYLESIFLKWLPKDAPILEAGCGRGQIVVALRERGYQIEGIDYSQETIEAITRLFPDLPVRVGDVTQIEVDDDHYSGYISIGVVEHRPEGPEPFLDEALRVLHPGTCAVITVPHLNPIRRLKARCGFYRGPRPDTPFYQYAFSKEEISNYIRAAGFEIVDQQAYGGYKGIIDEIPPMRLVLGPLKKLPLIGPPIQRYLAHCVWGHMLAIVARKPS